MTGQLSLDVGDQHRQGYRGPAVCRIVGITYRQLDYWARTGLVRPSLRQAEGSGTQRLYAFEDVVALRVVKRMLDAGLSLQKVRDVIEELQARGRSLSEALIASDGTRVLLLEEDAQVLDLLRGGQAVITIALEPVIEELRGEVAALPTEALDQAVEVEADDHTAVAGE